MNRRRGFPWSGLPPVSASFLLPTGQVPIQVPADRPRIGITIACQHVDNGGGILDQHLCSLDECFRACPEQSVEQEPARLDGLGVKLESDQINESSGALVLSRSMVSGDKMRGRTKSLGIGASPIEDLLVESQTIDLGCLLRFRIGCIKQELECPGPGDRHRVGHGRHA